MDQQQQWPRNPLGIESAAAALQRADQSLTLGLVVVMVLCAASLLVRFRRAQGIERQQLKWFSYAIALFALVFVAYLLTTLLWGEWLPNTASTGASSTASSPPSSAASTWASSCCVGSCSAA
jgi:hypothetical protein